MFTSIHPYSGIAHITDNMGVSFTLIEGSDHALLFDTGDGLEDVRSYIRTLTDKPVSVFLSHGHHDHILGARWFSNSFLCSQDMEEFIERSGTSQRSKVKQQAEEKKIPVPDDFMEAQICLPDPICFTGKTGCFESITENLGNLDVHIIRVPGHTPGSIVVYMPAYRLLLTGDDWNPCTWMWFPSSLSAVTWRNNMTNLLITLKNITGDPVSTVLCSHQPAVRKGAELTAFLEYMTASRMNQAEPFDMGSTIHTYAVRKEPEEWTLIFDKDKI